MPADRPPSDQTPSLTVPAAMMPVLQTISRIIYDQHFASVADLAQFLHALVTPPTPYAPRPLSNLDRAQDLIYQAWEAAPDTDRMVALARQALAIAPDCADGYVLLAELVAQSPAEAWAWYLAGVTAGERALGDALQQWAGHCWGVLETRPYMRARFGLAMTLWTLDRREEAAAHMNALLTLNPQDNQGVRSCYFSLLLELADQERIPALLRAYPDVGGADWTYPLALWSFRCQGDGVPAVSQLARAFGDNASVPPYLLGQVCLPPEPSALFYTPGDRHEAIMYVELGLRGWQQTPGALAWLQDHWTRWQAPQRTH